MPRTPPSPPPDPVRAALAACPPLAGLPAPVVDAAVERLWMRTLSPNEAVYQAGDPGDAMFVVASGRIAVRLHSPDGDAVDLAGVRTGSLFGYLELFDGGCRSADAVAVAPSRVVVIGQAAATRLFAASPELVLTLAREMACAVRGHVDAVQEKLFYPVAARLARFLLAAAEADGRVWLEGPQVLLAQRLGIARQTLSRALHRLATDGLVAVHPSGRVVTILDRAGLATVTQVRTRRSTVGHPAAADRVRRRSGPGAHPALAGQTMENPGGNGARPVSAANSTGP
jgi:CRP/FNR family transcriptional regulator, cyclic AMP receptor protein